MREAFEQSFEWTVFCLSTSIQFNQGSLCLLPHTAPSEFLLSVHTASFYLAFWLVFCAFPISLLVFLLQSGHVDGVLSRGTATVGNHLGIGGWPYWRSMASALVQQRLSSPLSFLSFWLTRLAALVVPNAVLHSTVVLRTWHPILAFSMLRLFHTQYAKGTDSCPHASKGKFAL